MVGTFDSELSLGCQQKSHLLSLVASSVDSIYKLKEIEHRTVLGKVTCSSFSLSLWDFGVSLLRRPFGCELIDPALGNTIRFCTIRDYFPYTRFITRLLLFYELYFPSLLGNGSLQYPNFFLLYYYFLNLPLTNSFGAVGIPVSPRIDLPR